MKKTLSYFLYTLLLAAVVCACSDDLDINQVYSYDLVCMPIQKKIVQDETVEIPCELIKEGNYQQATYSIRYFQNEGKGQVLLDNRVLAVNERYSLNANKFSLYYTSLCTEQQSFDIYIEDNFGQSVTKSFSFQNENAVDTDFEIETLPFVSTVKNGGSVEIKCSIRKKDAENDATYSIRYFQSTGTGTVLLENETLLPNNLYPLDNEVFSINYVSNCSEKQAIDIYIVDSYGQTIQKTFSFDHEPEPETDISFELTTLPVPKKIKQGETIEIRCQLKKADENNNATYSIRYFQSDGKGVLRMDNGMLFLPNDLYPLNRETFRLYYTSHCSEQQTIDVYIEDSFGQVVQKSFSLQNDRDDEIVEDEPEEDESDE